MAAVASRVAAEKGARLVLGERMGLEAPAVVTEERQGLAERQEREERQERAELVGTARADTVTAGVEQRVTAGCALPPARAAIRRRAVPA